MSTHDQNDLSYVQIVPIVLNGLVLNVVCVLAHREEVKTCTLLLHHRAALN